MIEPEKGRQKKKNGAIRRERWKKIMEKEKSEATRIPLATALSERFARGGSRRFM